MSQQPIVSNLMRPTKENQLQFSQQVYQILHGMKLTGASERPAKLSEIPGGNGSNLSLDWLQLLADPAGDPLANHLYAGSGRLVLISTSTITSAAPVTSVDYTGLDDRFSALLLVGANCVPATDADIGRIRVQVGGTFQAASYRVGRWAFDSAGAGGGANSTVGVDVNDAAGSDATEAGAFAAFLFGPSDTAVCKHIIAFGSTDQTSNRTVGMIATGDYRGGTGAITGIQFLYSTGSVESGVYSLWGLEKV